MTASPAAKTNVNLEYGEHIVKHNNEKLRRFLIVGQINDAVYAATTQSLQYIASLNNKPITVTMNSYGGDIDSGLAIYDLVRELNKTVPVDIVATGSCMSMAAIILQSARKRLSMPHTSFMLHQLRGANAGDLGEQRDRYKHMENMQLKLNTVLSQRTGMSMKQIDKLIDRKDYFISSAEALQLNLIDKIVEP